MCQLAVPVDGPADPCELGCEYRPVEAEMLTAQQQPMDQTIHQWWDFICSKVLAAGGPKVRCRQARSLRWSALAQVHFDPLGRPMPSTQNTHTAPLSTRRQHTCCTRYPPATGRRQALQSSGCL